MALHTPIGGSVWLDVSALSESQLEALHNAVDGEIIRRIFDGETDEPGKLGLLTAVLSETTHTPYLIDLSPCELADQGE